MPDKQERYRKRNAAQGLQRVEVIVPEALAPYLKAYARALRDAHALDMEPPLFEGMRVSLQKAPWSEAQPPSSAAQQDEHTVREKTQSDTAAPVRKLLGAAKTKPDFTKGLLDE